MMKLQKINIQGHSIQLIELHFKYINPLSISIFAKLYEDVALLCKIINTSFA